MVSRRSLIIGGGAAAGLAGLGWSALSGPDYSAAADAAWAPKLPTDSQYLLHYATRAANSHNTQPWRFVVGQDAVTIRPDVSRATPAADPDLHHVWASLGCATENLALAAAAAGRGAEAGFVGDDGIHIMLGHASVPKDPLFDAILARQCTRADYDGRSVPAADLELMTEAATVAGAEVILITDRAELDEVTDLIIEGNTRQVEDPAFRDELKSWLRFSSSRAVETSDGLYSACSGNPTMPDMIGRVMFDMAFTAKAENDKIARQIRSSAGIAVFVSGRDTPEFWAQAGRSYQRFALQATALGLRHAFLNQAVEVPEVRPKVSKLLGLGDLRPDLVVRFGYGPEMPRSLRRPLEDVIDTA